MPKLLLSLHLFHLKHDLGTRVTFLLKFRILALKGDINNKRSCLRSASTCWSEFNKFVWSWKSSLDVKEIKVSCMECKFFYKNKIKWKTFSPKRKRFGFNLHLPTTTTVELPLNFISMYLHSYRPDRSVNFACFSFATHRIYWNSISRGKNDCGKEKQNDKIRSKST